jgi:hypothetical protein
MLYNSRDINRNPVIHTASQQIVVKTKIGNNARTIPTLTANENANTTRLAGMSKSQSMMLCNPSQLVRGMGHSKYAKTFETGIAVQMPVLSQL